MQGNLEMSFGGFPMKEIASDASWKKRRQVVWESEVIIEGVTGVDDKDEAEGEEVELDRWRRAEGEPRNGENGSEEKLNKFGWRVRPGEEEEEEEEEEVGTGSTWIRPRRMSTKHSKSSGLKNGMAAKQKETKFTERLHVYIHNVIDISVKTGLCSH